jgi:predicted nucleotidyltransferase component of viral defense system
MNSAIEQLLARYSCKTVEEYELALLEIMQQVCLLGLWRGKFFEKAAFYGGTSLRILYGLDRFSQDLDFSLLRSDETFSVEQYFRAITTEFESFGFDVEITKKSKAAESKIDSAFLKGNTLENIIKLGYAGTFHKDKVFKIKFEVDRNPPQDFETEAQFILQPVPCSVRTYTLPNLFAGKMHAILFRQWGNRVKGRDWFDLVWFTGRGVSINTKHLMARYRQSEVEPVFKGLSVEEWRSMLLNKVESLDVDSAKQDVAPFLRDPGMLDVWSRDFFLHVARKVEFSEM